MTTMKQLTRSTTNRVVAGVCSGLGDYLDVDPTLIRLAFVFGFFISGGTALLIYLVLALVVPQAATAS